MCNNQNFFGSSAGRKVLAGSASSPSPGVWHGTNPSVGCSIPSCFYHHTCCACFMNISLVQQGRATKFRPVPDFPQGLSGDQGRDWLKGQEKPQGFWLALHGGLTSAERNLGSSWSSAFRRFFFCLSLANKGLYRAAGEPFTLEKLWFFRAGSQGGAWASSRGYISRSAYCKWTLQHCHVLSMTCCPVLVLPAPGKALTHLRKV